MIHAKKYRPVKLYGVTERAKKIINYYSNNLLLKEYDDYGRPLGIAPDGRAGIFCVSPDLFWNGWFVLDEEVIFEKDKQVLDKFVGPIV